MIDANVLTKDIADKFRTLNNIEAQDKYYVALLDSLEKNINTLRSNDFDSKVAVFLRLLNIWEINNGLSEQAIEFIIVKNYSKLGVGSMEIPKDFPDGIHFLRKRN